MFVSSLRKVKICAYIHFWLTYWEMGWIVWSEFEFETFDHKVGRAWAMLRQWTIPRIWSAKFRSAIRSLEICHLEISVSYHIIHLTSQRVTQKWMYSHIFTLLKKEANTYKTILCCINVSNSSVYICVVFYSYTSKII